MPLVKRLSKNKQLAKKQRFEANCAILRTIFLTNGIILQYISKPERVYLFDHTLINFYNILFCNKKDENIQK